MTVRTTMADLITRTRTLIYDTGDPPQFTDQQIQDALDHHRWERRFVPLIPQPSFGISGQVTYHDYYSDSQNWEGDYQLQDTAYNTISADTIELLPGHWYFASQPKGIGVRITGKTYDIYAAAAELLTEWAAAVKMDFSVQTTRDRLNRKEKFEMITALADKYRTMSMPRSARLIQSDAMPDHDGGGVTYPSIDAGGNY